MFQIIAIVLSLALTAWAVVAVTLTVRRMTATMVFDIVPFISRETVVEYEQLTGRNFLIATSCHLFVGLTR